MNTPRTEPGEGLKIVILPVALIATVILWIVLSVIAFVATGIGFAASLLVGLIVVVLYWLSDLAHHLGHAGAARGTGYPMQAIKLGGIWGFMALSVYPPDEPSLPDSIHLRRALGGPFASLLVALLFGALALVLRGGPFLWAAILLFAINLLFAIQIVVPLGNLLDNDGNTLLRWWRGRHKARTESAQGE